MQFRAWHLDKAAACRAWRIDQWWRFVRADVAQGGRKVFRWIRQPALQAPPPLVATEQGLQGGPAAEVAVAASAIFEAGSAMLDDSVLLPVDQFVAAPLLQPPVGLIAAVPMLPGGLVVPSTVQSLSELGVMPVLQK